MCIQVMDALSVFISFLSHLVVQAFISTVYSCVFMFHFLWAFIFACFSFFIPLFVTRSSGCISLIANRTSQPCFKFVNEINKINKCDEVRRLWKVGLSRNQAPIFQVFRNMSRQKYFDLKIPDSVYSQSHEASIRTKMEPNYAC